MHANPLTPRAHRTARWPLLGGVALVVVAGLVGCSSGTKVSFDEGRADAGEATSVAGPDQIVVHPDDAVAPVDRRLLGTNLPAWLFPPLVADQEFRERLVASGTTLLRFPGGSWSSEYDWLGCEQRDPDRCQWTWAMRPSDFVDLLASTELPGMWTVSFNGTAEEAAAAVAFFNGDVGDRRPIGTDRHGRDWRTVGDWARLRAAGGHPDPARIDYWEVGNEIFGAVSDAGGECKDWGWEKVWTCEGSDYVAGDDDHDGFLRFREAMVAVDPDIQVGAVGVGARGEYSDWDDEVIAGARDQIDFYVVHQYGSDGDVSADKVLDLPAKAWPTISSEVREAFAAHETDEAPLAITEHNLVAFIDGDDEQLMTTALNAFYLAETIGRMAENGVEIANQWNIANGTAPNGSDYGLIDAETHERSPAYYALALWARSGDDLVRADVGDALDDLVVYATRAADGSARLLVLNPSSDAVTASVSTSPVGATTEVTADEVVADSLESTEVRFNGSSDPDPALDEPGRVVTTGADGVLHHDFPAHSITLLRWVPAS